MKSRPLQHGVVMRLCFVVLVANGRSASGEMVYHTAERAITAVATQLDSMTTSTSSLDSFDASLLNNGYVRDEANRIDGSASASAMQTSILTGDQIRGLGRGSGFANGLDGAAEATGRSDMVIDFAVDEAMLYTLLGELRIVHGLGLNGSQAFVRLSGPTGVVFEVRMDEANPPNATGVVDFSGHDRLTGEFGPGVFTLEAMSEGHGSHGLNRCADFDFTFTARELAAVPEPTTVMLAVMASGVLGWHGIRTRRAHRG